jgi:Family of unknown function (DUF6166)
MKVYEGGRSLDGAVVTVDGELLDPLGDVQRALALTEDFMRDVVAELDNAWRLTSADVEAALRPPPPSPLPRGEGEH